MKMSGTEKEEKFRNNYRSYHKMLLVGEGDFSFSASLARTFGSAGNMFATSLDSKDEVVRKYFKAATHLKELEEYGCTIIHRVNALTMSQHPLLVGQKFHRIIFNFPHATLVYKESDPMQIMCHKRLVKGFLKNAAGMIYSEGEVHVTHKTGYPYNKWEIGNLANEAGLVTYRKENFNTSDFPGYCNKRAQGSNCDDSFSAGGSQLFRYKIWYNSRKKKESSVHIAFPLTDDLISFHIAEIIRGFKARY